MSDSDLFSDSDNENVHNPAATSNKKIKKITPHKKLPPCNSYKHTIKPKQTVLDTLWQSVSLVPERKKPYVYYTLKEILSFTQTFAPVNNKIRTVGFYQEKDTRLQYLTGGSDLKSASLTKVLLDFKLTEKFPLISQQIQAFGFIDFRPLEKSEAYVPILVVHFWSVIGGDVEEFVLNLQMLQRPLIVADCRSVEDLDSTFFENTTNIESWFEEINDTVFNEAAEAAEVVCKELTERLNVSDDLFE